LLPVSLYASPGLKVFANIISIISEFFSIFIGKALYLLIVFLATTQMKAPADDSFAHIMIFLTGIGGFLNTQLFNPTRDKFYAMFIMRMDARKYTLSNYFYFLLKAFTGFLPFSLLFGLLSGAGILVCLAVPFFVVSVKLCFSAVSLKNFRDSKKSRNENKISPIQWGCVIILLIAAFLPPYFGFAASGTIFCMLTAVLIFPAVFALRYVLYFDQYRRVYKDLLKPEIFFLGTIKEVARAAQKTAMQKNISVDPGQTSHKTGYKYFNEIFMKRHSKLLTKSAKRITAISAIVFAGAVVVCLISPRVKEEVNQIMLTFLPYFLFVMYIINRGKVITQAMFMNCDHSMLTYRFYRQPKAVLLLFIERLKYIIAINLMPALVISLGLPFLLFITGGTDQPLNYLLLFVSIIAMSVFFSVHNIVLYYLLQPYNVDLELKSASYAIVQFVTYIACYIAIGKKMPTLTFGTVISTFCILYTVVAFVLAYRLAPKTFRLRR
jgi:hypothetical protein